MCLAALPAVAQFQDAAPGAAIEFTEPAGGITLRDALDAALLGSPALAVYSWDTRIADARIAQARLRPNPELGIEIENIALGGGEGRTIRAWTLGLAPNGRPEAAFERGRERGGSSVLGGAEYTLRLSQLVELGGKRAARIVAAQRERETAAWDYEAARFKVLGETVSAFVAVLGAQERVVLTQELVDLAARQRETVAARVEAGGVAPLENRRASAGEERMRVELDRAHGELEQARIRLAAAWGASEPRFGDALGDLDVLPELPDLNSLLAQLDAHPALERWTAELAQREAVRALEQTQRTPDLTLTLGYRAEGTEPSTGRGFGIGTGGIAYSRERAYRDNAWEHSLVLEASVPLPIFHRNQGAIREAEWMVSKAADEHRAAQTAAASALTARYHAAANAHERVHALETRVLPDLAQACELMREGYERGKYALAPVLETERERADARRDLLETRIEYHLALADIERFAGAALMPRSGNAETMEHEE
jgi:cobalt-zinc-cadmium efflux system outer membrane protein